jgi:hypothetical protein
MVLGHASRPWLSGNEDMETLDVLGAAAICSKMADGDWTSTFKSN